MSNTADAIATTPPLPLKQPMHHRRLWHRRLALLGTTIGMIFSLMGCEGTDPVAEMKSRISGVYAEDVSGRGEHPRQARIRLDPDGTFRLWNLAPDHFPEYARPGEQRVSVSGQWSVGGDGDGSWLVTLHMIRSDLAPASHDVHAAVGDDFLGVESKRGTLQMYRQDPGLENVP